MCRYELRECDKERDLERYGSIDGGQTKEVKSQQDVNAKKSEDPRPAHIPGYSKQTDQDPKAKDIGNQRSHEEELSKLG
jgi:hypothetical protein